MVTWRRLLPAATVFPLLAALLPAAAAQVHFADGFESGTLSLWAVARNVSPQRQVRYAGQWAALATSTGNPSFARASLGASEREVVYGANVRVVSQGANPAALLALRTTSRSLIDVHLTRRGKLAIRNHVTGSTTTSTTAVSKGVWHRLELRASIDGSRSTTQVSLNGVTVPALSRTTLLGTAAVTHIELADPAKGRRFSVAFDEVSAAAASVDASPPTAPTGLVATAVASKRVDLTWSAASDDIGVIGYRLFRDGEQIATLGAQTSYQDNGVSPAAEYVYEVRAVDAAGNVSSSSGQASATTPPPPPLDISPPTAPALLTANASSGTAIDLAWAAASDDVDVTGYRVVRDDVNIATVGAQTSYRDSGLTPASRYEYQVHALDGAGNVSEPSPVAAGTTPDTVSPTTPLGLTASAATGTQVDLSWRAAGDNVGVTGYDVLRDGVPIATLGTDTVYQDTGLAPGSLYRYQVRARDAAGNSSDPSLAASATTRDTTPPTSPTGLTATAVSGAQVNLSWIAADDDGRVDGYEVWRDGVLLAETQTQTSYQDVAVAPLRSYVYEVRAFDAAGNRSAPSAAETATTPEPRGPLPFTGATFHGTWGDYTDPERAELLDKLSASGVQWVRVGVPWAMLQPRKPTATNPGYSMNWGVPRVDSVIDMAHARGLEVSVTLNGTPNWANGGQGPEVLPTDPADYARVARWAASRYHGKVQSWEVYNEPNLDKYLVATPAAYTKVLCASYPAFHEGSAGTKVIFGGTAGNDWKWIRDAYQAKAKGCFDVMATHPYQGESRPPTYPAPDDRRWWTHNIRLVRDVMTSYGDGSKPVWFTEFGWSTKENTEGTPPSELGVTHQEQAEYLVDFLNITADRYPYVQRANWYTSRDERTGDLKSDNFGLFTLGLEPKPSALALRNLLSGVPAA